jgi:hypothetical protein
MSRRIVSGRSDEPDGRHRNQHPRRGARLARRSLRSAGADDDRPEGVKLEQQLLVAAHGERWVIWILLHYAMIAM